MNKEVSFNRFLEMLDNLVDEMLDFVSKERSIGLYKRGKLSEKLLLEIMEDIRALRVDTTPFIGLGRDIEFVDRERKGNPLFLTKIDLKHLRIKKMNDKEALKIAQKGKL